MINLIGNKNGSINTRKIVEILFYSFPLSFIIGNLILSIHLIFFILISFYLIKKNKLESRFKNTYWLLIFFFLYLFLLTFFQFESSEIFRQKIENWSLEENPIFKSFILVRFLILIFIIDVLFFNKILELKKLFLFTTICTSFVSLDVIFQYFVGFDFFGFKGGEIRNSGPFGSELIAGGYLQKFSFFSFFYFFIYLKKEKIYSGLTISIITLHLTAMLLSGSRMPMILALFGCFLIIVFIKNFRILMSLSCIAFTLIFTLIYNYDSKFNSHYNSFVNEINLIKIDNVFNLIKIDKETSLKNNETNENVEGKTEWTEGVWKKNWEGIILLDNTGYNRIYRTSIAMWLERPLFGFGLKSFRIKCWEILEKKSHLLPSSGISKFSCANHSHNHYIEILTESGLIGLLLMLIFFFILLKESFYYSNKYKQTKNSNLLLIFPVIIVIFIEIWPIRSSGSFFTTWTASFFWFNAGILLGAKKYFNLT